MGLWDQGRDKEFEALAHDHSVQGPTFEFISSSLSPLFVFHWIQSHNRNGASSCPSTAIRHRAFLGTSPDTGVAYAISHASRLLHGLVMSSASRRARSAEPRSAVLVPVSYLAGLSSRRQVKSRRLYDTFDKTYTAQIPQIPMVTEGGAGYLKMGMTKRLKDLLSEFYHEKKKSSLVPHGVIAGGSIVRPLPVLQGPRSPDSGACLQYRGLLTPVSIVGGGRVYKQPCP